MFENLNPAPDEQPRDPGSDVDSWPALPASPEPALERDVTSGGDDRLCDLEPPNHDHEDDHVLEIDSCPALDDWKDALRHDFEQWLASIDEIPVSGEDRAALEEEPDLYSFYEQLASGNAETRKANRRTAEVFSQWAETLSKFEGDLRSLREQLARPPAASDALPRPWCLALIELVDRLHRLAAAFATPPPKSWWGGDKRWRNAWETQRQGFEILLSHVATLLKKAEVARIQTLHEPFDPAIMAAVAAEPSAQWPHGTVLEEVAAGYRLRGELLRVAQVKVSTNQAGA